MDWDVFISHASEDKESFARPLAEALEEKGLRVWYDEFTLRVGDSLNRSINHGLANSRYGIVILSPHFFKKEWPQKELDGLVAREASGEKVVLPIWHEIGADEIRKYSPVLADRVALSSGDRGLENVVSELLEVIRPEIPLPVYQPSDPEMTLIPAGEFLMGSDSRIDERARETERPQHTLCLPDYYIARTPVTNSEYVAFVRLTNHRQPDHWEDRILLREKMNHPVVNVSWEDATAYCDWLSDIFHKPYRLPSEAEWEKAARGTDGRIYPWGNEWDPARCNSSGSGIGDTTPVIAYPEGASPYGLLDMAGNVWEWTISVWGEDYNTPSFMYPYDFNDGREDIDQPSWMWRVIRGGAFNCLSCVRSAARGRGRKFKFQEYIGLRVAMDVR